MNAPFFSIIVPVYNSENYLSSAIDSIVDQSFDDWELLLIDDGSTDSSGAICDAYSAADARIKTKHIENAGMCHARNIALAEASGRYVAFCDNDDHYLPGLLESVFNFVNEADFDVDCICYGRYLRQYSDDGALLFESEVVPPVKAIYIAEEIANNYEYIGASSDGVWSRCYRREFLFRNQLVFDESLRHGAEDILFNALVVSRANSVGLIPVSYYEWLRREGHSTSMTVNLDAIDGIDRALSIEVAFLCDNGFDKKNPKAFSRRIVSQMPFQIVNVRRKRVKSLKVEKPLYKMLREVYAKYDDLIVRKELLPAHRVEYTLLMGGHYRLLLWFVLFSGLISRIVGFEKA